MISGRRTAKDLVEEAKKRAVLLLICVFGLSYLMSLTSSSVWINLPAAAALIIFGRFVSLDFDIRRRATIEEKLSPVNQSSLRKSVELHEFPIEKKNWRRKVNSPPVEAAIEQFTRHLVSEWVTDLWYSRVTPDRDGPEELMQIMNNVLAEISSRARDINLINLLSRDIINLLCNHLEVYRLGQSKIKKEDLTKFPTGHEDTLLRLVLAADNKLHPALFSVEAEHKVLQHLMNGLIHITFRPEDLQCTFFRYTVRELLACAVFRPVLNLANPRVINEKIESLVLSLANKADKGIIPSAEQTPTMKPPPMPSSDEILGFQDRSTVGVELVKVRHALSSTTSDEQVLKNSNGAGVQEVSINSSNVKANDAYTAGGEWAQMLDMLSRRKTQVLAPENLDSMWTKGRNYKKKEGRRQVANQVRHSASVGSSNASQHYMKPSDGLIQDRRANIPKRNNASFFDAEGNVVDDMQVHSGNNRSTNQPVISYQDRTKDLSDEEVETDTEGSYQSEDDDNNTVTGLDSPGTRVWDSKNKTCAAVQYIRHPLETSDLHLAKKNGRGHSRHPRIMRTSSGRKRPRSSNLKIPTWQEVERTSFLLGEGHDILHEAKHDSKTEESSDDPDAEIWNRIRSGEAASSSLSSISTTESCNSSLRSLENSVLADSFLKLRCEVLGANIVKSGPGTFAVYSIAVTDANNNSWSIKRRYRHFEELHKRLKEFPEYNLSLPPKHFLSSGLDVPVVQERCKLLDKYLKMLLQLPTISGSIEVWDFLSVDSQTYMFSDSLSIIQTLSVNLADKSREKGAKGQNLVENINGQLSSNEANASQQYNLQTNKNSIGSEIKGLRKRNIEQNSGNSSVVAYKKSYQENAGGDSEDKLQTNTSSSSNRHRTKEVGAGKADDLQETSSIHETDDDAIIPTEWVPPNLSVPILNLVDVVFQLQDGGWIRRQAFRVAKQLLQLGMGDAFDDWLIEKIQLLRKGTVIASVINRVERILWPDGIFLTKHPNRKPPTPVSSPGSQDKNITQKSNSVKNGLTYEQQLEAERRAKFVYEFMIDKAPPTLVSLVGRKEYEQCIQDVYFFLQSSICLKQLALELLELILLALFPELDDVVRQCHEDKERFGAVEK